MVFPDDLVTTPESTNCIGSGVMVAADMMLPEGFTLTTRKGNAVSVYPGSPFLAIPTP